MVRPGFLYSDSVRIDERYSPDAEVTLHLGDRLELLRSLPANSAQLIVTSPPYNIGKRYEPKKSMFFYQQEQALTIKECVRILSDKGSICWQVGNHVGPRNEIWPLDIILYPYFIQHGLRLRNRIIWHFEHGLHCKNRFSGRYETILWFTKTHNYVFNLDPVRVPQKYPGKRYFKGPKVGQYSSNPLGKNPGDIWIIPNVKHNHVEKTIHPCQFPVELVERLVLALTNEGDLVVDPYIGVGTTAVAAILHGRRAAGADTQKEYIEIAKERLILARQGRLRIRPMYKPVYEPPEDSRLIKKPFETQSKNDTDPGLF